ncbi:hypothetical protein Micbo1qcDRAFT_178928 [Microdochium bolleyi]|uniref:Uncharacterized protein n=1 Tax=Microdochium bolleyi TaxID=196109 RepID=A0A136IRE0_9PEZI|nr:hypothetical protein Micbo1qcDRAFT_178928 [Microdochium bolleyi]
MARYEDEDDEICFDAQGIASIHDVASLGSDDANDDTSAADPCEKKEDYVNIDAHDVKEDVVAASTTGWFFASSAAAQPTQPPLEDKNITQLQRREDFIHAVLNHADETRALQRLKRARMRLPGQEILSDDDHRAMALSRYRADIQDPHREALERAVRRYEQHHVAPFRPPVSEVPEAPKLHNARPAVQLSQNKPFFRW